MLSWMWQFLCGGTWIQVTENKDGISGPFFYVQKGAKEKGQRWTQVKRRFPDWPWTAKDAKKGARSGKTRSNHSSARDDGATSRSTAS